MGLIDRLQHAWNAFTRYGTDDYRYQKLDFSRLGSISYSNPGRIVLKRGSEKTLIGAVYNRIAVDCSSIKLSHVILDENNRYKKIVKSGLNNCLDLEANKDQTSRQLIRDIVLSMFDEGCVAVAPIIKSDKPVNNNRYDIYSLRVGKITQWYPDHVTVELYDDRPGQGNKKEITLPKEEVAIIENPLYASMNERDSIANRLIHKLALLDAIDDQSSSGKLDLIIQLPYTIKTETKKTIAKERQKDIEDQLNNSKYGVAYIDGTEKVIQLNRPVENNLMTAIEYLTRTLHDQLGITAEIMNGTASEQVMQNYMDRTIKPIMDAICDEFKRKFLSNAARSEGQSIMYFNDPFRLVPVSKIADIADKLTRNEIMSSNELRQIVGLKPVNDPRADELRNKNINSSDLENFAKTTDKDDSDDLTKINSRMKISDLMSDKNDQ